MAPFQYQSFQSPYANTIAQLLLHQNDPQAQAAQTIAAAQARAGEQSAAAWGGAVQGMANAFGNTVQTIQREQEVAPKLAAEKIALQNLQQKQAGEAALSNALADHTIAPGAAGPQMPSFMTADHRYDIPALTEWLNGAGYGAQVPDLIGHSEKMNESLDKAEAAKQEAAAKNAVYIGNVAQGALKLNQQINVPLDGAVKFMAQQGLASGQFTQEKLDAVLQRMGSVPPDQQQAYLQSFVDAADKLQKTTTVKADETVYAASGRKLYEGEPKKDETWLQNDAATYGKPNQTATAAQSLEAVRLKNPEWWLKNDAATVGQPNETKTAKQSLIAVNMGSRTAEQDDERFRQIRSNQRLGVPVSPQDLAWVDSYKEGKLLAPNLSADAAMTRLIDTFAHSDSQLTQRDLNQTQRDGRAYLSNKVDAEFYKRTEAADTIEKTVRMAQGGNLTAAQLQVLETTMGAIRAQNLNRINTAEIHTNANAGSILDNIEGWIGKRVEGQPVPPNIQRDMVAFAAMLRQQAQYTYSQEFTSAKGRYKLGDETQPLIKIPKYNPATGKVE